MDRTQLRLLLDSGPSRRLNVLETTTRLLSEGRDGDVLFNKGFLNRSILLKAQDPSRSRGKTRRRRQRQDKPIRTLVFLPYDACRPGDGGEALAYSRDNFRQLCARLYAAEGDGLPGLEEDEAKLELLDSLPTLDPFLLREAFGKAGRAIPEPYLALDNNVSARLRRRLSSRVRPLVISAFGGDDREMARHLESVLDALIVPERREDLQPLGRALQIDPGEASEVLSAWAGIVYFEDELDRLKPFIFELARWLAYDANPLEYLPPDARRAHEDQVQRVRTAVRAAWREIRGILDEYRDSYIALVFEDRPQPFVRFLRNAYTRYWRIGALFGAFEQAVSAFELYQEQHGDESLPVRKLEEFMDFLVMSFHGSSGPQPVPAKKGGASSS